MKHITSLIDLTSDEYASKISLIVSDLDYTLINFDKIHQSGIQALSKEFNETFAQALDEVFSIMLSGHRKRLDEPWELRSRFEELLKRVAKAQHTSAETYGTKAWSRETWVQLVAEDLGMEMSKQDFEKARNAYWNSVEHAKELFYDDALVLLNWLNTHHIPLWIFTGSDSVVQISEEGVITYEPEFSHSYKKNRIDKLNIDFEKLYIADPHDKPHLKFFEPIFTEIEEQFSNVSKEEIVFLGDSPRADLEVPESHGYQTVFIDRKKA